MGISSPPTAITQPQRVTREICSPVSRSSIALCLNRGRWSQYLFTTVSMMSRSQTRILAMMRAGSAAVSTPVLRNGGRRASLAWSQAQSAWPVRRPVARCSHSQSDPCSFRTGSRCTVLACRGSRQHHSVERGDALRILEKSAAVASAALSRIFRQQVPALRAAI